jgi:hypothetical protein
MLPHVDTSLWLLPALLLLIALAAPRYGVDSRDGHDWNRRFGPPDPPPPMASRRRSTPAADLAALARLVRRAALAVVTRGSARTRPQHSVHRVP